MDNGHLDVSAASASPDEVAYRRRFLLGSDAAFITAPMSSSTAASSPPSDRRIAVNVG